MVLVDWAWAYFTYQRGARVVAEPDTAGGQRSRAPRIERHGHTHLPARLNIERIREVLGRTAAPRR
jgi:hypothetical protein